MNMGAQYKFFFIFKHFASISRWIRKHLEIWLMNFSIVVHWLWSLYSMAFYMVVYTKSVVSTDNLVRIFKVWKWVTWKTEKNFEYLWHYSTDFSKTFTKMIALYLSALTLITVHLCNLVQCQIFMKRLRFDVHIFLNKLWIINLADWVITKFHGFPNSVEIGQWFVLAS